MKTIHFRMLQYVNTSIPYGRACCECDDLWSAQIFFSSIHGIVIISYERVHLRTLRLNELILLIEINLDEKQNKK